MLDSSIINYANYQFLLTFSCLVQLATICILTPILTLCAIILVLVCYGCYKYCAAVVLSAQNMSLVYRGAPILNIFSETIKGMKSVRIYGLQELMRGKITMALRNAMRSTINYHKSMVFYMQTLKALLLVVLIVTVFLIVFLHGWNNKIVVFYSLIAIYDLFEYLDEVFVYAVSLRTGLASMEKIDRFIKDKKATV